MKMPESRYILPSFVEHSSYGAKESNPYNKLFEERIIFLGTQVDDAAANDIMAQLLVLEGLDPDRDITMTSTAGGSYQPDSHLRRCSTSARRADRVSARQPLLPPCCSPQAPRVSAPRCRMPAC